jgi:manganese/zinc/iron transport system substrate-binding protein
LARVIVLLLSFLAAMLLPACQTFAPQEGDLAGRQIRVVTTTGMLADLVQNVGGERVQVQGLMGPGVDPHGYKASEGDVTRLSGADVIFYNGLELEAQMGHVFEKIGDRIRTVAVGERIPAELLLPSPDYEDSHDPHIWFDVRLWMEAARAVRDALTAIDPEHRAVYESNTGRYLAELEDLHSYVTAQANRVPPEQRVLITAHDAFGYFGQAYGFEVAGLQGISTVAEASAADVQALAIFISEQRIPAVFVESSVPTRTIEALQAAVRSRGFQVQIGGELYSDSMGSAGTPEGSYTGMVRANIDTIVSALAAQGQ